MPDPKPGEIWRNPRTGQRLGVTSVTDGPQSTVQVAVLGGGFEHLSVNLPWFVANFEREDPDAT